MGQALCYSGRVEDGIAYLRRSIDIDRRDPTVAWRQSALAIGLFLAGDPAEALKFIDKAIQTGRPFPEFNLVRTVVLEELDRHDDAGAELTLLRRKHPDMTLATVRLPPFANSQQLRHFTDNLRAAGLPE
jgi:tetratricopeptide (TPR) repeat protein